MKSDIKSFEDLEIWQEAHSLVLVIYRITKTFPINEVYGIISQLKRAAFSVAACIAEGQSRHTTKEFIKFLYDARGSCAEVEYFLILAKDLGCLDITKFGELRNRYQVLGKRINALINSLNIKK